MLLALAWLAAALAAGRIASMAWHHFDRQERADGNRGHATIDFGGSWTMGRMLVEGRGSELYEREALREVLEASYGKEDAAKLLSWFMPGGTRDGRAITGPLYPPINAFVTAPLGRATSGLREGRRSRRRSRPGPEAPASTRRPSSS